MPIWTCRWSWSHSCVPRIGRGNCRPAPLPLLEDRIRVRQGMPQIYGTQIRGAGTPYPIENPEGLEERRRNAGLEPFEDYLKRFQHP